MTHISAPTVRSERRFAHLIVAPSPANRDEVAWFCVDPIGTIRRILESGLVDRFAEYEGLVHGDIDGGTAGLMTAVALFRGLRSGQEHVLTYVTDPLWTYTYPVPHRIGLDPPTRRAAYPDSVFVAYTDTREIARRRAMELVAQAGADHQPLGLIYNWEWVLRSKDDPSLPDEYETRYGERIW
ncbi:MAG TPA: hypothetical protein VNF04_18505 [Stellaceae bacterium]|nr:hypothetical protein [Stellaceae bacterium]